MKNISKNNFKCLDNCHPPNEIFIHPQTKKKITNTTKNYICSVAQYTKDDKEYYIDECKIQPIFLLTSISFLQSYYKIYSLEDLLLWLDNNKNLYFKTKERIFNISFLWYINELIFIDNRIIEFISEICIFYFDIIYNKIKHLFPTYDNNTEELEKIIKSKYIGKAKIEIFFTEFIKNNKNIIKYSNEYKNSLINKSNISLFIVDEIIKFILNKI